MLMIHDGAGTASARNGRRTVAVVVNFRTADDTIAAVRSLQTSVLPFSRIVVVDNGSGDGSVRRISSSRIEVELIEESENRGFSAGGNAGIRRALQMGADRIFLMNADATVSPDALATLERVLGDDGRLGIVGPIVVSKADPEAIESFGISFSRRTGRMRNLDFGKRLRAIARPDRRSVDAVTGCAMLIKSAVFERAGMLDEDYFFGFEDVDFCLRAREHGFATAAAGGAIVFHQGQASIGRSSASRIYFATRNHVRVGARVFSRQSRAAQMGRALAILGFNFAHAVQAPDVPRLEGFRGFLAGARDHYSGRYGCGSFRDGYAMESGIMVQSAVR